VTEIKRESGARGKRFSHDGREGSLEG